MIRNFMLQIQKIKSLRSVITAPWGSWHRESITATFGASPPGQGCPQAMVKNALAHLLRVKTENLSRWIGRMVTLEPIFALMN